jgi:hypothetical protein
MKVVDNKLKTINQEWHQFALKNNIRGQVNQWAKANNVEQRMKNSRTAVKTEIRKLDRDNNIHQWGQGHNISRRFREIRRNIRQAVKVTNGAEIIDTIEDQNSFSDDEIMLMTAVGVIFVAATAAAFKKNNKKTKEFEFEVDTEMVPTPTPKENKKAIKKTLKNIMAKNNAKTTLIA